MRISDLNDEQIVVGLRIWNIAKTRQGTIVKIDLARDRSASILWDGDADTGLYPSGFYGNDCECELVVP